MKSKLKQYKSYFVNLIFPALIFGSITGILTSLVVTLFKLCAKFAVELSEKCYEIIKERLYLIPVGLIALFGVAFLLSIVYKKHKNLCGGGIPASIAFLRGIVTFKWLRNVIGTFLLSLVSFLVGVPLGTEGPSVQIGTAIGRGSVYTLARKHKAWDRYSMTGGACAGFSVATGAPISGIMFAIEEAHQRISPMIVIVASTSVLFSRITSELLAMIEFIDKNTAIELFSGLENMPKLMLKDVWLPIVIGIVVGVFAVLFLSYYHVVYNTFNKLLSRVPHYVKIFVVMALTLIFGVISLDFISTGHHLTGFLMFDSSTAVVMLIFILLVRSTLTILASSSSITGGLFLPIMSLGAVLASIIAKTSISLGVKEEYYTLIIAIGITACVSGMMKMPLTAIFFAVESLSCYNNIVFIIIASAVAFVITEICNVESINDNVIEKRIEELHGKRETKVVETTFTVKKDAFAVGKQIRDIFWPAGLIVLSVVRDKTTENEADMYGGKAILEGDVLNIRYRTCDEEQTLSELYEIIGKQDEA